MIAQHKCETQLNSVTSVKNASASSTNNISQSQWRPTKKMIKSVCRLDKSDIVQSATNISNDFKLIKQGYKIHPPSSSGLRTAKGVDREIFHRRENSRSNFTSSKATGLKLEPIDKPIRIDSSNHRKQQTPAEIKPPLSNLYRAMNPYRKQQKLPMPLA